MASAAELCEKWAGLLEAPERLPLSDWARKNFSLSRDYSATSGNFEPWGWQNEPLNAFTDPEVNMIVLQTSTQMLKTILMQISLAYVISEGHAQGPVLFAEPTDDDASTFSKERLAPMIRDNPKLWGMISDSKSRDSANTISSKLFPNGSISLVGANSPGNFARRTIQYFFADEVDKYKATSEGDQIKLGIQRMMQFGSRSKIVLACSPTVDGRSRIQKYYEQTDKREPFAPCPHCGEYQVLRWSQVRWREGDPLTAKYYCLKCDTPWTEAERWKAADRVEWRAKNPEVKSSRGYWISHLYSRKKRIAGNDPKHCLAADFLQSKEDPSALQVFVNTSLAETWRETGDRPQWESLRNRAEDYPCNENAVVPMAASFLTAAVDFQKDWLQVELKAWGRGRQNWSLGIWKVERHDGNGNPLYSSDPSYRVWLQEFLQREWVHECGAMIPIFAMACDTGNNPEPVYEFARGNNRPEFGGDGARVNRPRTVICVKGDNSQEQHRKAIVKFTDENTARRHAGLRIIHVGGGFCKTEFYDAIRNLKVNEDGTYPNGFCHLPRRYDDSIFRSFAAEERIEHANGTVEWAKIAARNEALDCHVYNRAAAYMIGVDLLRETEWAYIDSRFGIVRDGQKNVLRIATPAQPTQRRVRAQFQG